MDKPFVQLLAVGGKSNSLGEAGAVVENVLHDPARLEELYACMFEEDSWLRMRAADSFEKICRAHPEWLEPYIDRLLGDLTKSTQPSIMWHLAQIFAQVRLDALQKAAVIAWLQNILSSKEVDWIVAANAMKVLVQFTRDGSVPATKTAALLRIQLGHKSNAVVRRAAKLLNELQETNNL